MFCQNCGVQLAPVTSTPPPFPTLVSHTSSATTAQPELQSETVEPVTLTGLPRLARHLVIRSNNAVIVLDKDRDEWLVGRSDPVRGIFPEVDLSPQGGEEYGVSRRQARLVVQGGRCFISDLNSTNFTFLNGEKLQPGRLYPLKPGDEIHFGLLALTYSEETDK
jgi:pSer/pThr/pTyr-binding forkhead associated (FHA) protein